MNTIALTDETVPSAVHSSVRSVVDWSLPQSSAFTIKHPGIAARWSESTAARGKTRTGEDAGATLSGRVTSGFTSTFTSEHAFPDARSFPAYARPVGAATCDLAAPRLPVKNRFNRCICSRRRKAINSADTGLGARRIIAQKYPHPTINPPRIQGGLVIW
jgi:hypothetical protein